MNVMRVMARLRWAPLFQAITSRVYAAVALFVAWPLTPVHVALALVGLLVVWPIFEWWIHRVFLHGLVPDKHHHHHVDPRGDLSIVPPIIDLLMGAIFLAMGVLLGWRAGSSAFAGFVIGYGIYNDVHWCLHAGYWPKFRWCDAVARRHRLHHQGEEANYNVLLPIGDWLFRTYRSPAR